MVRVQLGIVLVCVLGISLLVLSCAKDKKEAGEEATRAEAGQQAKVGTPGVETQAGKLEVGQRVQEGSAANKVESEKTSSVRLPRLIDLGRNTCIPCKMMAPILEELKKEYEGRAIVEVIDLRENRDAARKYRIRVIPTQILFDRDGNEVWRHEGYIPKEQLETKLAEVGARPRGE